MTQATEAIDFASGEMALIDRNALRVLLNDSQHWQGCLDGAGYDLLWAIDEAVMALKDRHACPATPEPRIAKPLGGDVPDLPWV